MEREYRDLANEYTNGTICCPYHPAEGTYYLIPSTWKMKDFKEFGIFFSFSSSTFHSFSVNIM